MATIGTSAYQTAVHTFFEGICTFDAKLACSSLSANAHVTLWNGESFIGPEATEAALTTILGDVLNRASFTINDIQGDGAVVRLYVTYSPRFGAGAKSLVFHILHLDGQIRQIITKTA